MILRNIKFYYRMNNCPGYLLIFAFFATLLLALAYLTDNDMHGGMQPMLLTDDISIGNPASYSGRVPVVVSTSDESDCRTPLSSRTWLDMTPMERRHIQAKYAKCS